MKPFLLFYIAIVVAIGSTALFVLDGCCAVLHRCPAIPASELDGGAFCAPAGARLKELGCAEARPDFEAFCKSTLREGVPINPECLSIIKTCGEVDSLCRK